MSYKPNIAAYIHAGSDTIWKKILRHYLGGIFSSFAVRWEQLSW